MPRLNRQKALSYIRSSRVALAFPVRNESEPPNLWACFHPRSEMRWEWDSGGDQKVSDLWIFREALSRSGKVVYSKWYREKATFIDLDFFPVLLAALGLPSQEWSFPELSKSARTLFGYLLENSPLSTKELKKISGMTGRDFERDYSRALRELWQRLWIVGWGEKDEGAFPSLNIGATQILFESEWKKAQIISPESAIQKVEMDLAVNPKVLKFFRGLSG